MKTRYIFAIFSLLVLCFANNAQSQTTSKRDSLIIMKYYSRMVELPARTTTRIEARVYKSINDFSYGNYFAELPIGATVVASKWITVVPDKEIYCLIQNDTIKGYVDYYALQYTRPLFNLFLLETWTKMYEGDSIRFRIDSLERAYDSIKVMAQSKIWAKTFTPERVAEMVKWVLDGECWIGMEADMARIAWGYPDDVNRTITASNTHEQWVYGEGGDMRFLYFENGKLTTIQD